MSNLRFQSPKKKSEGKGFYIALVGCLAAIVAVTWTAVGNLDTFIPENSSVDDTIGSEDSELEEAAGTIPNQYVDGFDWGDEVTDDYNSVMSEISSSTASAASSSQKSDSSEVKQTGAQPVSSSGASSKNTAAEVSSFQAQAEDTKQSYMLPVGNEVFKEYSDGKLVYSMTFNDWRVHEGVDFKASKDDVVRSAGDGTVKDVINDPMYGTTVIIDHGDFEAHYCGLVENVIVEKGQEVKIGDDLGSLGDIPCEVVEELHLHFGVKKDGKWVDPVKALRK